MEIDWVTVSAQVVNFLILVWLLKRFLYRPVLRAMDHREQGIRQRLSEAEEREAEAEARLQEYHEQQADLERHRQALLSQAEEEAAQRKQHWLEEARAEVTRRRETWQRQLDEERQAFLQRLGERSLTAVEQLARRALHDLAGAGLEEQLVEVLIERLTALDEGTRERLARADGPLRVATSFGLSSELRERLTAALKQYLANDPAIAFTRSTSLICGIELVRGGRRLGWSLGDYLEALHDQVDRDFTAMQAQPEVQ